MEQPIEIVEKNSVYTLEIKERIPGWKIQAIISRANRDIEKYLSKSKSEPSGSLFVRYVGIDWNLMNNKNIITRFIRKFTKKWNMVIGFPVKTELKGRRKIRPGVFSGGKYVKTIHRGAYQKVGNTYLKLLEYLKSNDMNYKPESVEIYLNDPYKTNEEDLETIVMIPISE